MDIGKYYLDLDKISKMESQYDRDIIHGYYKEMLYCFHDGRSEMSLSIMNTLEKGGYLINLRDKKLEEILE